MTAEAVGTFALVLIGTGAMVVDDATGGGVGPVGIALAFGLVVTAMIYAVGDVSGAHLNPAVTLGFAASRRHAPREVAPYVAAQCIGAVAASALLRAGFPQSARLGATVPTGDVAVAFGCEVVLTFFLVFVILNATRGAPRLAGLAIGGAVAMGSLAGGPVSGASMNPARSLGPALVSGTWDSFWLYLAAPAAGALLATAATQAVRR